MCYRAKAKRKARVEKERLERYELAKRSPSLFQKGAKERHALDMAAYG